MTKNTRLTVLGCSLSMFLYLCTIWGRSALDKHLRDFNYRAIREMRAAHLQTLSDTRKREKSIQRLELKLEAIENSLEKLLVNTPKTSDPSSDEVGQNHSLPDKRSTENSDVDMAADFDAMFFSELASMSDPEARDATIHLMNETSAYVESLTESERAVLGGYKEKFFANAVSAAESVHGVSKSKLDAMMSDPAKRQAMNKMITLFAARQMMRREHVDQAGTPSE